MKHITLLLLGTALITSAIANDTTNQVLLLGKDAKLVGEVGFYKPDQCIAYWSGIGSSAVWKLPPMIPGSYMVTISYSLEGDPSTRKFEIATTLDKKSYAILKPTGGWNTFKDKKLIPIAISSSNEFFTITAIKVPPKEFLMNLKQVFLEKTK